MSFCTQCAHAMPADARFCPGCGATIAAPPVAAAAPGPSRAPTRTSAQADKTSPSQSSSGVHGRFEPGTRLGTRYRVVGLLGRGGMGEVYRADDLDLGQSVALKFLPEAVSRSAAELARFRSEVRVARQIAHPNVCRVYDIGEIDGHVFLSMEYIDGEDLAAVLRRMGRPTTEKAIEIARQICLGLAAAHEAGMLHRDLKPANVMIDGRGRARITDFGLAGLADDLSRAGEIAGTPSYMAPEQLAGGAVSVRSDIFSLGLVLYELFTGKRAFPTGNVAELRRMHESGVITTPSDVARDIDPAVERVILHCVERDPELRPPSAYAVLGALPGGDPLAAALAAGETPSPELVANAGGRGSVSPPTAFALVAAGIAGIGIWAGTIGPEFRPLKEPTQVLSVRAADILVKTGTMVELPPHSAEGFAQNQAYLKHLRDDRTEHATGRSALFFWRRWSPASIEPVNIHTEIVGVDDPPHVADGEAVIALDPEGRLLELRAVPPDTLSVAVADPDWSKLFAAAGLDLATFAPVALARPVPAMCDSAAAWAGPLPWWGGETVTVQMGASRGRLAHFTMVHDWDVTTPPEEEGGAAQSMGPWNTLVFTMVPLVASIVFAVRNLRLGRGDWRGATRIATFVFLMNMFEAVFTTKLSEVGLTGAGSDWMNGRAFGHSLIHGVNMWLAYMALEPYVRRLWPGMLVGWARLVSGRGRDPLVGRDLLIGGAAGAVLVALGVLVRLAGARLGLTGVPTLVTPDMLASLASLGNTGCHLSYGGSICVLDVLNTLVILLLLRLLLRRTWPAVALTVLHSAAAAAIYAAPTEGWPVAIVGTLAYMLSMFVLMRFGLLAAVVAAFFTLVMGSVVPSLDLASWYADRALVPLMLLLGTLAYGAAAALGGKPILGDPLRETKGS